MSDKYVFQNAKIKHMESKLITSQAVQRLIDCASTEDAFKVLLEMGFGSGVAVEPGEFDLVFAHEEENAVALLKEFNVSHALDAFLVEYDYLNLKSVFKAHATKTDFEASIEGLYKVDEMKELVDGLAAENLPAEMKSAVDELLELERAEKLSPRIIDVTIDKAMFKESRALVKKSGELAKKYLVKKIDYLNISSFLRVKKLSLPLEFFKTGLFAVGGGMATLPFLSDMADKTGWFTQSQLADMVAVSESTPGPIGVNMATYVGFSTAGIPGALIATLGLITPSVIVILIIARVLQIFRQNPYVDAAFYGLRPCSVGLIAAAGLLVVKIAMFDFERFGQTRVFSDLFRPKALLLAIVLLILTRWVKPLKGLHPIFFILGSALVGILFSF